MAITAPHQYLTKTQVSELLAFLSPTQAYSDWIDDTITDTQKDSAIYESTIVFDDLPWKGYKLYQYQDHAFPRKFTQEIARSYFDIDISLDSSVGDLPYPVAMGFAITAAFEAYNRVNSIEDEDSILMQGFSRISIGQMSVELKSEVGGVDVQYLPDEALRWLRPYSLISSTGRGVSTFRMI